jgi:hypothetical protein
LGRCSCEQLSRSDKSAEQRDAQSIQRQILHHTRPETHQNLIHLPKNNSDRRPINHGAAAQTACPHTSERLSEARDTPNSGHSAIQLHPTGIPSSGVALIVCKQTTAAMTAPSGRLANWAANGAGGDDRDRTGDPLLAKQVLSQLSYAPNLEPLDPPLPDLPSPGHKHHWRPS